MLYLLRAAFIDGRIVSVEALMVLLRSGATSPHASNVTWMPLSSAALFVLVGISPESSVSSFLENPSAEITLTTVIFPNFQLSKFLFIRLELKILGS